MTNKKLNFWDKMSIKSKHRLLRMGVSIAIGLLLAVILIVTTSERPMTSLKYFFTAPISDLAYFSMWIQKTVPLIFTGVAVCIMFSCNQFNLGLEGSFLLGGFIGGALSNIYLLQNLPDWLAIICASLIGGVVGAIVTFIPAILEKLFKAPVMVVSLMMNYISLYFSCFLLFSFFKDPKTSAGTYTWCESPMYVLRQNIGNSYIKVYFSLFVALAIVVLAYLFLYRTKTGFKLRQVGQNANFAKYVGINVTSIALLSQIIGGFIGGVGGASEVMSIFTTYSWVELTGFGWDGVTVAVFANNNPKNVPLAAFFIAYLRTGAYIMSIKTGIQVELTYVVEAVIILFLLAEKFLSGTYRKMIMKEANQRRALAQQAQQEAK